MEFEQLRVQALEVRQLYQRLEKRTYGREWTREELVLGLVGDVGDLVKLVQAAEGVRAIDDAKEKLAHELADCLWSLLVIAEKYDIDLQASFIATMEELKAHINSKGIFHEH